MPHRLPPNPHVEGEQVRRRIAIEAARLIVEEGMHDHHDAKRKAVRRLGLPDTTTLPRNTEIDEALREHQRLFRSDSQPARVTLLREAALEAMQFLERFQPRLVGAALDGTADEHSAVCLHLFCDNPDDVLMFLGEHAIPFAQKSRRMRTDKAHESHFPAFTFVADDVAIDLTVFSLDGLRQPPLDRVSGKPMRRATMAGVQELIAATRAAQR